MGALLGVDTPAGRSLLFANPHNDQSRERRNLVVKRSDDDGRTWRDVVTIEEGAAGYSDLASGADGTVYCLYERGGGGTAFKPDALTLARFRME
jgi:sialidase-1